MTAIRVIIAVSHHRDAAAAASKKPMRLQTSTARAAATAMKAAQKIAAKWDFNRLMNGVSGVAEFSLLNLMAASAISGLQPSVKARKIQSSLSTTRKVAAA